MCRRHPVVRGRLFKERVAGSGLDVQLNDEVCDEHQGNVEEEVGGEDEEEGRGVVLSIPSRLAPAGGSAEGRRQCYRLFPGGNPGNEIRAHGWTVGVGFEGDKQRRG